MREMALVFVKTPKNKASQLERSGLAFRGKSKITAPNSEQHLKFNNYKKKDNNNRQQKSIVETLGLEFFFINQ